MKAMAAAGRIWLAGWLATCGVAAAAPLELKSPDGRLTLTFGLEAEAGIEGVPVYRVSRDGKIVLNDSSLGFELADGPLDRGFRVTGEKRRQQDSTWRPVAGERSEIRDRFRELTVELEQDGGAKRRLQITFRAYDEGVAFCYTLPAQPSVKDFTITREVTGFSFAGDHPAWAVYRAQGHYDPASRVPLSRIKAGVERPLTVQAADDLWVAVTEAKLVDYARMKLRPAAGREHTLEAFLDAERGPYGKVTGTTPFSSPWRVVMVADSPGKLLENNDLVLNLNDPCAIPDTTWIKPGKVIRETTLTTVGGIACVDFAVRQGLQYIEYDAGWYGHEYDPKADASAVHLDPRRNPVPDSLDLRKVIDYANSKGIGVILYVNHLALEKQIDEILPLYQQWGVKGVKYGFVNVGSQQWTRWLHEAVRKAARHRLMVDIHDEFRSTGYQRTFPNLMTVEGILGNEGFPSPVHHATLPFTRFLTGPGDYTFCWYSGRLQTTRAHQLALSTIFFSPWQFLYWYDRPSNFDNDPALDFWKHLPTTWDETRVITGDVGKAVTIARRKGEEWYVGAIRVVGEQEITVPLSFLSAGRRYTATIHTDLEPGNPASKKVKIEQREVDSSSVLTAKAPANGGMAVRITP